MSTIHSISLLPILMTRLCRSPDHCHHSYHSSGILCYLTVASCRVLIESNENRQRLPPAPTRRKPYIDTSLPFLLLCSRRKPIYSQAVVATYVYIMTSGAPMQPRK